MSWNDGYFDKKGKQLSANDDAQEVYDGTGKRIGYFSNGVIRSNNGDKLANCIDDTNPNLSIKSSVQNIIEMFSK